MDNGTLISKIKKDFLNLENVGSFFEAFSYLSAENFKLFLILIILGVITVDDFRKYESKEEKDLKSWMTQKYVYHFFHDLSNYDEREFFINYIVNELGLLDMCILHSTINNTLNFTSVNSKIIFNKQMVLYVNETDLANKYTSLFTKFCADRQVIFANTSNISVANTFPSNIKTFLTEYITSLQDLPNHDSIVHIDSIYANISYTVSKYSNFNGLLFTSNNIKFLTELFDVSTLVLLDAKKPEIISFVQTSEVDLCNTSTWLTKYYYYVYLIIKFNLDPDNNDLYTNIQHTIEQFNNLYLISCLISKDICGALNA